MKFDIKKTTVGPNDETNEQWLIMPPLPMDEALKFARKQAKREIEANPRASSLHDNDYPPCEYPYLLADVYVIWPERDGEKTTLVSYSLTQLPYHNN